MNHFVQVGDPQSGRLLRDIASTTTLSVPAIWQVKKLNWKNNTLMKRDKCNSWVRRVCLADRLVIMVMAASLSNKNRHAVPSN